MAKQASTCVGSSESGLQFPLYLLPPIPFFRKAKTNPNDAVEVKKLQAAKAKVKAKKKKKHTKNAPDESEVSDGERVLHGHTQYLKCRKCQSDLCFASCIISKGFMGRHGRAYLLSHLETPRITIAKPTPRPLVTGMHTVADISCSICATILGWKYITADEEDQKYKIGKYILERERVVKVNYWDGDEGAGDPKLQEKKEVGGEGEEEVEVDSQDEDELEDLFLGVWTKETALKRRKLKEERKLGKGS